MVHVCPVAHTLPQAPQLFGSLCVSAQEVPHNVVPPPHDVAHVPCEQTVPLPQTFPHAPQLLLSVWGLEHVDPHWTLGAGHDDEEPSGLPPLLLPHAPAAEATPHTH